MSDDDDDGRSFAQTDGRTVLLGRADVFADALSSGGAVGILGAPLLLTDADALHPDVAAELERLVADRVVLLGGTAALSEAVEQDLVDRGYEVQRVAGATRLETAVAVAEAFAPDADTAVLARAHPAADGEETQGFADALAAGALAAHRRVPLLLTETDRLSAATAAHLQAAGITEVLVVGGTAAVGDEVVADLEALGITVTRLGGATRFATATVVAAERGAATAADAQATILVDGTHPGAWADAFPAAVYAGRGVAPIVLADGDTLPDPTTGYLNGGATPLICGTTVSDTACATAAAALDIDP